MVIEGQDWITLDTEMTTDENVGWLDGATDGASEYGNDAGFDTRHPVGADDYVSDILAAPGVFGTKDRLYFRIGLKSQYTPIPEAPARYGVVLLVYNDYKKFQRIWIRQGEEADYMFGPADNRPNTMPFSPYNLTGPNMSGTTLLEEKIPAGLDGGGVFTNYPSQIGAMFNGVSDSRTAFNSFSNAATNPPSWALGSNVAWSTNPAAYETCPTGYRRATDGPTNVEQPTMDTPEQLATSEVRQSLFRIPPTKTDAKLAPEGCISWGYYADGFFDRRQPKVSTSGYLNISDVVRKGLNVVSNTNNDIAAIGWIHYNVASSASLFFPATGQRNNSARLHNVGAFGYYNTSDARRQLHVGNIGDGTYRFDVWNSSSDDSFTAPVRCVYDEMSVPPEPIITVPEADSPVPTGVTPYVGAFWKADQTGERLIRIARPTTGTMTVADGKWTAQVVEGEDWIVLDKTMTSDTKVGWITPTADGTAVFGNDPAFETNATRQLTTTGDWWVKGKMDAANPAIYFRIGLKSPLPGGATAAPRYGVVLLTYKDNSLSQRIFIRQGEEADYVFNDAARPNAKPFPPYNLTAAMFNASVSINGATDDPVLPSAIFTDYPSQGGAYWQWSSTDRERYAWAPVGDLPAGVWTENPTNTAWSTSGATNESCPAGYSRPNLSTLTQSLWSVPTTNLSATVKDNVTWGYYADGWFDRQRIVNGPGTAAKANAAVSAGNNKVAYNGLVFFNPDSGASLFVPAVGQRVTTTSAVNLAGDTGTYWLTDVANGGCDVFTVSLSKGGGLGGNLSSYARSIRCVKE
jgi:hypothetical protein